MANIFNTRAQIVERYDIKGSWYGRENSDPNPKATKKDNDFKKRASLELQDHERDNLMRIIRKDAVFFREHEIIDYSLLIGVIKQERLSMMEDPRPRSRDINEIED